MSLLSNSIIDYVSILSGMDQDKSFTLINNLILNDKNPNQLLVTLTYAQSINGIIGQPRKDNQPPLQLSSPDSFLFTHCLRQTHDSILVGINTLLSDSPSLTTRYIQNISIRHPRPVIIDPSLRIPLDHYLLSRNPVVVCRIGCDKNNIDRLESKGAAVIVCDSKDNIIDLKDMKIRLELLGLRNLMVEGGAKVIGHFLEQNAYDGIAITICPIFVGNGVRIEFNDLSDGIIRVGFSYHTFGTDLIAIRRNAPI